MLAVNAETAALGLLIVATPIGWVGLVVGSLAVAGAAATTSIAVNKAFKDYSGAWYDYGCIGYKMTLFSKLLAFSAFLMLIAAILFVLFGQITVRRLRNKSETENSLGIEFASGWDILNVAQALALPKYITQKLAKSPLSGFYADREILEKYTTSFERFLAKLFWFLYVFSVVSMLIFIAANSIGLLD